MVKYSLICKHWPLWVALSICSYQKKNSPHKERSC
jgi:hypothetical protein